MYTHLSPSSPPPPPYRAFTVLQCAILSRIFVFLLSFLLGLLHVPDYDTSSHIASLDPDPKPVDRLIDLLFGRFVKWDAIYFVRIAQRGYEYEQFYAFYPLYPMVVRYLAKGVQYMVGMWISERALIIVSGFFVSNLSFVLSALELYKLGCVVMRDENTSFISSVLYTINPASIFMSAVYTESTFALFAFAALHLLTTRQFLLSSLFFFLCTATRSNGILFVGFIVFRSFNLTWHKCFAIFATLLPPLSSSPLTNNNNTTNTNNNNGNNNKTTNDQIWKLVKTECTTPAHDTDSHVWSRWVFMIAMCLVAMAPMSLFQYYGTSQFCTPENQSSRLYCRNTFFPSLYGHVQTFYWNQGLFHYYESKQIPNFLLAGPMVVLSIFGIYTYFYNRIEYIQRLYKSPKTKLQSTRTEPATKSTNNLNNNNNHKRSPDTTSKDPYLGPHLLPYILYWAIILVISLTFMHVQVITRFFSSCPAVYWFCGHVFKNSYTAAKKAILCYFLFYVLVGTALFGLYYPWT